MPDVVHEGAPLRIELKTDYLARKRKEYEEQKVFGLGLTVVLLPLKTVRF